MREIKFRAYIGKDKRMLYVDQFYLLQLQKNNEWKIIDIETGCQMYSSWDKDSKNELMQYTGLNDKNRKEIYEKDIVEIEAVTMGGIVKNIGIIVYEPEAFSYLMEIKGQKYSMNYAGIITKLGNIYENPELLKGE